MRSIKSLINRMPVIGSLARKIHAAIFPFDGVGSYWERRYAKGGNSGAGSFGRLAYFKADTINNLVDELSIQSIIEFGFGDGNQLSLYNLPDYTGFEISRTALDQCRKKFKNDPRKKFLSIEDYTNQTADATMSIDVIYHLVQDDVFHTYMHRLFTSARSYVIVYSDNTEDTPTAELPHIRHRKFTNWVDTYQPQWRLLRKIVNKYPYNGNPEETSFADFYIFKKSA